MTGYRSYRHLRIFVSSTFQDMLAERNILVSKVFPVIAEYCHSRKVEFTGVDLRWGVTDEQAHRGETVDICMAEIDKCRPLFIGMLGERYGWVPDGNAISVTEQEIRYGALEAPDDTEAFFYLRDPELTRSLAGPFDTDPRQDELKERIRASGYPVLDGYRDLETFEDRLIRDLTDLVDRIVDTDENDSAVEDRRQQQIFMAQRYAADYIRREELTARLGELTSEDGLILVTGESGMGKTSLVSDWVLTALEDPDRYVFLHYAGSSQEKGWESLCRQLTDEIRLEYGIDYPEAQGGSELRKAVNVMLNMAAARRGMILVIDQPEALADGSGQELVWIPEDLPAGVTIVISADESGTLRRLRLRDHTELTVGKLSSDEITHITEEYLASYSKSLGSAHMAMLAASGEARDPLYLITVLNEIRQTGRHEELTGQFEYYLASRGTGDLFSKVLQRIDKEFGADGSMLPEKMLRLMEACRGGIGEAELISILGDLPQAKLAPLRLALDPFTAAGDGSIDICVPEFRDAVRKHYNIDDTCIDETRGALAEWFTSHRETPRRSYVLPWLLERLGRYPELAAAVSEPECLSEILERDKFELKEYWARLSAAGFSPADSYEGLMSAEPWNDELMTGLAEFLAGAGAADAAKQILERVAGLPGSSGGSADERVRCRALGILGNIYLKEGQAAAAFRVYSAKLAAARRTGDRHEQLRALGNIGIISMMSGDPVSARQAFENVLTIGRKLNNKEAVQIALGNLGNIAFSAGDLEEAGRLYRRQLDVSTESGNTAGMINAYGAIGVLHLKNGEFKDAGRAFGKQEELSRRTGSMDSLANALGNIATIADAGGARGKAEELLKEKLKICRQEGMPAGEQNALGNLAQLALAAGDPGQAYKYADERVEVTKKSRMIRQYAQALTQLAAIEEQLSLNDEAASHRALARVLAQQGGFSPETQ